MCVIIVKPTGQRLTDEQIENCYINNPDGMGYMYAEDGKVHADKFLPENLGQVLEVFRKLDNRDAVIHFRFRTTGEVTSSHCHPFRVLKKNRKLPDLFFMHNGTFSVNTREGENDTIAFKNQVLKPILSANPDLLNDSKFMDMLEKMDSWSRLAFLDGEGNITLTRESSWIKRNGCTLSNSYSLDSSHRLPTKSWKEQQEEKQKEYARRRAAGEYVAEWGPHPTDPNREVWYDGNGDALINAVKFASKDLKDKRKPLTVKEETTNVTLLSKLSSKDEEEDVEDDASYQQFLLKSMDEETLFEWVCDEPEEVFSSLKKNYTMTSLAVWLAYLGICYADEPTDNDIEDFISDYPNEVVDFLKNPTFDPITNLTSGEEFQDDPVIIN